MMSVFDVSVSVSVGVGGGHEMLITDNR